MNNENKGVENAKAEKAHIGLTVNSATAKGKIIKRIEVFCRVSK